MSAKVVKCVHISKYFPFRRARAVWGLTIQHLAEAPGQRDVLHGFGRFEQRGDLFGGKSGDSAADLRDEEIQLGIQPCELDEFIDIGLDGFDAALHGGYGIALALEADTLSPDGSELHEGQVCGSSGVHSGEVASENEDFVGLEGDDVVGRYFHGRFVFPKIGKKAIRGNSPDGITLFIWMGARRFYFPGYGL